VLFEILPEVAVTVVVPTALAVARPLLLSIVATAGLDDDQVICGILLYPVPPE
jgi:hypothetical protein